MLTDNKLLSYPPVIIHYSKLEEWVKNFLEMPNQDIITRSALINYEILESFMQQAKLRFDHVEGFRIYFIRFSLKDFQFLGDRMEEVTKYYEFTNDSKNLTQVSLAIVPTYNFQYEDELDDLGRKLISAKDYVTEDGKIFTIVFSHPKEIASLIELYQ